MDADDDRFMEGLDLTDDDVRVLASRMMHTAEAVVSDEADRRQDDRCTP